MCKYAWIVALGLFLGCQRGSEGRLLPVANSEEGRILFVVDTAVWRGGMGLAMREVFAAPIPGMPQGEPAFLVSYVSPAAFNTTLRRMRHVVFLVFTEAGASQPMSSFFSAEVWAQMDELEAPMYRFEENVYAREQQVLFMLAKDTAALLADLPRHAESLRHSFERTARTHLQKKLLSFREKGIEQTLRERHPFSLPVPKGYQLVKNEKNFVWLRLPGTEVDKNIFVHAAPYRQSLDSVKERRMEIGRRFFRDPEKPSLYMTHQEEFPLSMQAVNFKGLYALETRGLWKLSDNSMGGPFVSYSLVDSVRGRLYYVEGFVYCPSQDKRRHIRELEALLWKFSP